ncbi:hypothetical protein B0T21DRAFT_11946 [Apiosordaria backusii]|uniref:Uncharacterized protein n=1 Tax=Apiosordaria backusii TaxID=314023 RepID=A0AA40K762_9PEZI|nr:hypothetical protein B0T21DRAFT_11946 [Apiosordaria backusii]
MIASMRHRDFIAVTEQGVSRGQTGVETLGSRGLGQHGAFRASRAPQFPRFQASPRSSDSCNPLPKYLRRRRTAPIKRAKAQRQWRLSPVEAGTRAEEPRGRAPHCNKVYFVLSRHHSTIL